MADVDDCIFCKLDAQSIVAENDLAIAIRDKFPAKPLHTLIIPKRHTCDVFDCTADEREALHTLAVACLDALKCEDPTIEGVNLGYNIGNVAGQKIFHTHLHLIPRRKGDLVPPPARGET
jgi:diadenosine tetraphosphate (Ap4A) HIT family hydrolase